MDIESGLIQVPVARVVKKLKTVSFLQPLYEAVTNSIEANATSITVDIFTSGKSHAENGIIAYITGYSVKDNGDGFTVSNLESFNTYLSEYKSEIGCKGIGRFTWLAIFKSVTIESILQDCKINISFDYTYDKTKPKITNGAFNEIYTKVTLTDSLKNIENLPHMELEDIRDAIQNHLFIKLHLMKNNNKDVAITIQMDSQSVVINSQDLPKLSDVSFYVTKNMNKYKFTFYHYFADSKKPKLEFMYCANERTVKPIQNIIEKDMLNSNKLFMGLLQSDYLDESVNDARTNFNFPMAEPQEKEIEDELRGVITTELIKHFPELEADNQRVVEECINEYPHLADWIRADRSPIKNKAYIIKKYKEKYDEKKEKARSKFSRLMKRSKIDEKDFVETISEISHIQALELAEYVYYREQIIKGLKMLYERHEKAESLLHSIFMEMKKTASQNGIIDPYHSNLWLLDDRFMSYSYIASDTNLKIVKEELGDGYDKENNLNRPDILLVYSNNENVSRDAVIIEFKGVDASNSEKRTSIAEIADNIGAVRDKIPHMCQIWGYIITEISEEFEKSLIRNGYDPLFVNNGAKMYHKYHEPVNSHVYVLDVNAVITDAETRNTVFLNILRNKN